MGLKIDRFTWGIILGVLLLIAGAIITVVATGGRGWQSDDYLNEDTPGAVVHDAFLAFIRNEPDVAMSHYSKKVLDDDKNPPFRERFSYYDSGRPARRLRILDVDINEDEDKAYVSWPSTTSTRAACLTAAHRPIGARFPLCGRTGHGRSTQRNFSIKPPPQCTI